MCGFFGYISFEELSPEQLLKIFEGYMNVQVRGPDKSDFKDFIEFNTRMIIAFHRLSIMDRSSYGDQPFTLETDDSKSQHSIYVMCNGEIYNYLELSDIYNLGTYIRSGSDCEVLPHLYARLGFKEMIKKLRGEFAICVIDINRTAETIDIFIGRDQTAVRPVFFGKDEKGFAFSSILKGIVHIVNPVTIRQVNRAEIIHLTVHRTAGVLNLKYNTSIYHQLDSVGVNNSFYPTTREIDEKKYILINSTTRDNGTMIPIRVLDTIRAKFIESVIIRLKSDRPIGAMLSGGVDSSLVVTIASTYLNQNNRRLRTFSIGIPGSTDREYAEMVARHCNTDHTHIELTEQNFLDAIPDVIHAIESFDITSVRASVGQLLASRWIKQNTDIKVLLIGDGSDELCSGYMYFHNAPSPTESHLENVRLLDLIHYYDTLRADRCIAYYGIEARVPFLDHEFVDLYLSIPHEFRIPCKDIKSISRKVEKWLLRKVFDTTHNVCGENIPFLPPQVLWRKKEAFSDGVSSKKRSWYTIIQYSLESMYTDHDFKDPDVQYHMIPPTKEALHYRKIFNKYFNPMAAGVIPQYWMPRWSGNVNDPSARLLSVYES